MIDKTYSIWAKTLEYHSKSITHIIFVSLIHIHTYTHSNGGRQTTFCETLFTERTHTQHIKNQYTHSHIHIHIHTYMHTKHSEQHAYTYTHTHTDIHTHICTVQYIREFYKF